LDTAGGVNIVSTGIGGVASDIVVVLDHSGITDLIGISTDWFGVKLTVPENSCKALVVTLK